MYFTKNAMAIGYLACIKMDNLKEHDIGKVFGSWHR
jgi:hypothetical protein